MSLHAEYTETDLIQGCIRGELKFQKLLYKKFYSYSMSVCLRYAESRDEAAEILNDGFMKIFTNIKMYTPEKSFKGWLRRIMVNTAIDHFRRNSREYNRLDLVYAENEYAVDSTLDQISAAEIMAMVQQLPPAYRMVFNLYAIEGYTHPEIAEKLEISEGTSKSNLFKARLKLQKMIMQSAKSEEPTSYAR